MGQNRIQIPHCVKSCRIWSSSGLHFPAFRLNTERQYLSVFSPNGGKYGPEKPRIRTLFTQCISNIDGTFGEELRAVYYFR